MKKSTKNIVLFLLLVLILAIVFYFSWKSNQAPIDGNLNEIEMEDVESVEVEEPLAFGADFNLPIQVQDHQIIVRPFYTLSYNKEHEQTDWVAYKMLPFPDSLSVKRKDAFRPNPFEDVDSASLADYKKSGYDRGHLASLKAIYYGKEYNTVKIISWFFFWVLHAAVQKF